MIDSTLGLMCRIKITPSSDDGRRLTVAWAVAGMQASVSGNTFIIEEHTRRLKNVSRSSSYVRARYWALLRAMRQEFLGELLEMEALCSVLCCLHNTQPEVSIPAANI